MEKKGNNFLLPLEKNGANVCVFLHAVVEWIVCCLMTIQPLDFKSIKSYLILLYCYIIQIYSVFIFSVYWWRNPDYPEKTTACHKSLTKHRMKIKKNKNHHLHNLQQNVHPYE
jgi:hypothetical protein